MWPNPQESVDLVTLTVDIIYEKFQVFAVTLEIPTCSYLSQIGSYVYADLPRNTIFRLSHRRNGDRQGQEKFLVHSAYKQTHNYDAKCSNHRSPNIHKVLKLFFHIF